MEEKTSNPEHTSPVLLKYKGNYPAFIRNVKKYLAFINQVYSANSQVGMYLEYVEDGLIFIYKSIAFFKSVEKTIPFEIKNLCNQISPREKNFLLEGIENGEDFPPSGFETEVEPISHPPSILFPNIKEFHESMHPDIRVTFVNNKILLMMPHFDALKTYADLLFTMARYHN